LLEYLGPFAKLPSAVKIFTRVTKALHWITPAALQRQHILLIGVRQIKRRLSFT
jgi:hypothetical protein